MHSSPSSEASSDPSAAGSMHERPMTSVVIGKGETIPNALLPLPQLRAQRSLALTPAQLAQRRASSRQRGVQQQIDQPSEGKMWKFQEDQTQVPVDQESTRGQSVAAVADFEPNVCIHGRALDKCRLCAEQLDQDR